MAPFAACGDAASVLESLVDLVVASAWAYPLIALIAALDAVFPVVPSEATVIAAAALAGAGELVLGFVLLSGATGAVIGDNAAYLLGGRSRGFLLRRLSGSARWRSRFARAEAQLRRRGGTIILVSRFVPGGRTATMLSAGIVGLGWGRFAAYDLAAGVFWAAYASLIGWLGGRALADEPWQALLLGFALAASLALVLEVFRRWLRAVLR
jgi:membrane protein DedA with SNARE-associated domain